jgi:hypothetical protein
MSLLGSTMAGRRPLGLSDKKGSFLTWEKSISSKVYGRPSSSRIRTTFQGLGEGPLFQILMDLRLAMVL